MWYCKYLTYTFIKQYIFPEVWPMYLMLYLIASYLWIKFSIPAFPKNDNGILNPWIKTCTHWQTGRLQIQKTKVYGDTQLTVNGRKWPQFQLHLGNQVLWQRRIWWLMYCLLMHYNYSVQNTSCAAGLGQSLGAVWKLRWPSWAFRPNEPYSFCGRKAILNHA